LPCDDPKAAKEEIKEMLSSIMGMVPFLEGVQAE
jgi:hypothetical protein